MQCVANDFLLPYRLYSKLENPDSAHTLPILAVQTATPLFLLQRVYFVGDYNQYCM